LPPDTLAIDIDGSDEASVDQAFEAVGEHWGALDGFVNAAGFMIERHPRSETSLDEFDITKKGNLRATFLACRAAIGAYIRPQFGPYAASKADMIAVTKTFALEHAPRVRANAVAPGPVDTAFLRGGTGRSNEDGASTIDITHTPR
jgi:NAD(P)-dependent dehydrogenase (short-subunit alcohol dehydrogenase family)